MLWRGLTTACRDSLMRIVHFLKDAEGYWRLLTTRLPSSITKLMNFCPSSTAFIRRSNSLLKKRNLNVYYFLMSMSKEKMLALKPVNTKNPLLLASIYVGSSLFLSNVKKV